MLIFKNTYFESLALFVEVERVAKPEYENQIEDAEEGGEDGDGRPGEAHQVNGDCLKERCNDAGLVNGQPHLKDQGESEKVETDKCVHSGVGMSELVDLDHGQSHDEVHHGCVKLQAHVGGTDVEGG